MSELTSVVALGGRAFEWLAAAMDAVPASDDPANDLVAAGTAMFRRLAVEHPTLFAIGRATP